MNKTVSIIITLGLIVAIGIVLTGGSTTKDSSKIIQNTEIKEGIQYITIDAKGGYSPQLSNAKAGIPTKLIVKTSGTYDCSASLVIKSINYQKILSQSAEEIIDIGIPKVGEPLRGTCGMGMYNFEIDFS
ncbi:MAG: hypothetical protein UR25_C0003G0016 [Candidatus Nomurabacteria bacterium GW2011_GWE1_32_28]|uniref:EfeO-type cupredoxin-like domain-containing protein n=1 Tax=Candidatus Nomurabacteria bacterium GW2011_GWF1_31_48 TaxID=1618767 RepID=A0A0F9YFS2_9BACT|nr:MAG: hypothetical protein UR10_C0003G0016 [Candidatus Nomurabacteria bacterium GW2011_GWF2_30_133]KKP28656.1 MAG: hypothetical protein UR18_C0002G0068 [Candidatus Nomurabacteria bacterium GW2011_GWE2_31_40]KKP30233.1 MAG: hypothetical protein UR19_C0003G0069 [Candidatus Nomurabacteria bacterium GW2011_GWF1_31_48]KKP34760.1 MAG: hypothetical protein UR25_C0003G0016 [Candidatus Nomurabacteria bacterium GW2011_GWE1_32_28]HAS80782.1 hypothetical protein [Candidatus Nomurabacteria bacterium]